ncbi:hypothetical protein DFH11DRAFT_1294448 [Phellopilus nigrolimitatus]|nr:hypothetical protein DFH11DRAFT_1294448 [Phellopilus nigrolimitatus]
MHCDLVYSVFLQKLDLQSEIRVREVLPDRRHLCRVFAPGAETAGTTPLGDVRCFRHSTRSHSFVISIRPDSERARVCLYKLALQFWHTHRKRDNRSVSAGPSAQSQVSKRAYPCKARYIVCRSVSPPFRSHARGIIRDQFLPSEAFSAVRDTPQRLWATPLGSPRCIEGMVQEQPGRREHRAQQASGEHRIRLRLLPDELPGNMDTQMTYSGPPGRRLPSRCKGHIAVWRRTQST